MNSRFILLFVKGFLFVLCLALLPPAISSSWADDDCPQPVGKLVSIQGEAQVQRNGQSTWQLADMDMQFCAGDMLRVNSKGRAAVFLTNESVLRVDQKSTLIFTKPTVDKRSVLELLQGVLHIFSHRPRSLKVVTPYVNGAVEGTEFLVSVDNQSTIISVFEGLVAASNDKGQINVSSGQSIKATKNTSPSPLVVVRPRDAVAWTLYYPLIIDSSQSNSQDETAKRLAQIASDLSVGRIDTARQSLDNILKREPKNSEALALYSIIETVSNNKDKALELALQAVENDQQSAAAGLALSYAYQAQFDIPAALAILQKTSELAPANGLVKARLAEILLSTGDIDNSLETASEAVSLNPNIGLTQSILGFVHLSRIETEAAQTAFSKAIELDPAFPLARLGLGLAKIRDGHLAEGRADIEIAAALDPGNSLIRSYLGKAYYEEKRDSLARRQYDIAKELDPADPTPWYYDAIRKQTINRPVEALHDLQRSIALNDNRAVYRSRLLLDSDEAARSASLARIYNDLGFQQRALVEGWQSVNTDPGNFSAHRFLADSYSALPRHEIARVSELLQSQLLQPVNITPVQPRLAESNLFLINAGGVEQPSSNEFNSLFNRNRITMQATGLAGENGTLAGEAVISGVFDRWSLSAGYSHFETDGWRENGDQEDDITDIFAQYTISQKTSIQAEYRHRNNKRGDLSQLFFDNNFMSNVRNEDTTDITRFGFRHAFLPGSDLIGNFQYLDGDRSNLDSYPPVFTRFDAELDEQGYGSELSYLLRSDHFNIITGGGYYNLNSDLTNSIDFFGEPIVRETVDLGVAHTNLYLYSHIKPSQKWTLTLGASSDFLDPADDVNMNKQEQFNPKLGVSWNLFNNTTLRGAAFRVLKRTLIADQTIEPTQVAGFNQFYDELNATDYWVFGGAVDQKFRTDLYGGVEFTHRDLTVPFRSFDAESGGFSESDWDEELVRAYLFWAPHNWLSFSAEYLFERLERDEVFTALGPTEADTHRVPLGVNFFHPSGLSASLKGTFVHQEGDFERQDEESEFGTFYHGEDNFFLLDAAVTYRFPRRYGFISLGIKNLTDEEFQYFNSDMDNILFQPTRFFYASVTVSLP